MTRSESNPQGEGAPRRQRIARLIARAGLCSRREAEAWIVAGRVSLNGGALTSPAVDVSPEDAILVDGQPLPKAEKTRLFLFHKPRGLVTTDRDPEGRATVADFLRANWPDGPRVVTVGRLDINTEGLLLLTNDGGLARVLELPQTGWLRRYRVRAKGAIDPVRLDALANGLTIDGVTYAGIEAKLDRVQGANTWLTMGLREGKNREIKRVLEHLGLEVNRLIRLSFGPFQLLDLPEGAVDEVRTRVLREQVGPTLAAQAGVDFGSEPPQNAATRQAERPPPARRPSRSGAPRGEREASDRQPRLADPRRSPRIGGDRSSKPTDGGPTPKRERPTAAARKHVSTLRSERLNDSGTGQRVRLERSDTRDRHDRVVKVERLTVAAASAQPRERQRDTDDRRTGSERGRTASKKDRESRRPREGRGKSRRDMQGDAGRPAPRQRGASSPSAEGKRARIARSGGSTRSRNPDERKDRPRATKPTRYRTSSDDGGRNMSQGTRPPGKSGSPHKPRRPPTRRPPRRGPPKPGR